MSSYPGCTRCGAIISRPKPGHGWVCWSCVEDIRAGEPATVDAPDAEPGTAPPRT